jgi:hypothetical protein
VLTERCDSTDQTCSDNGKQFKGMFMRTRDRDAENRLGQRWSGAESAAHPNVFDWRTQASVLSALVANVLPR